VATYDDASRASHLSLWNDGTEEQEGSLVPLISRAPWALMADMHRGIAFSSWEHMLADGSKERQAGTGNGASDASLVKSRP
jgi:hypothetical protein